LEYAPAFAKATARQAAKRLHFADDRDGNFSPVWRAAMFEQENALPRAELYFSIHHGYCLTRTVSAILMCDGISSLPSEPCVK